MKKMMMFFSLILLAVTASAEAQSVTCSKQATVKVPNKWSPLITDQKFNPIEGSYLGKGKTTGQTYFMHLLKFHGRDDLYTAIVENRDTEKAWVGVLERGANGVFNWRNILVGSKSEDGSVIEKKSIGIDFIQAPTFSYEYEFNGSRAERFVGTSLNSEDKVESVAYSQMRQNRLSEEIGIGVWRTSKYSLTVIPQFTNEACPGPRSYSAKGAIQYDGGEYVATPLELRPSIFAGIYTAHVVQQADYERRAKREITYIVANIAGFDDGWRDSKKSKDRVLVFSIGDNFLPDSASRMRLVRK